MAGIDNSIILGVGNISFDTTLGEYYQDISPALVHITNGVFADIDDSGIPYCLNGDEHIYAPITIIQYALMCFDLLKRGQNEEINKHNFLNCVNWLEGHKVNFYEGIVWQNSSCKQYGLSEGWISGMVQGQAISVYLRAYQLCNDQKYLNVTEQIFKTFHYDCRDGGFNRYDQNGCVWFEEYPTSTPSYVLNGFIYSMFGILDLYRVTKREEVKKMWESCLYTLEVNLPKYDVWYWSVYDQLKKQLVSYYYQKNVHIPLMKILFLLTHKEIFNKYAIKWEKNLKNPIHKMITKIMYRVQPRIKKIVK